MKWLVCIYDVNIWAIASLILRSRHWMYALRRRIEILFSVANYAFWIQILSYIQELSEMQSYEWEDGMVGILMECVRCAVQRTQSWWHLTGSDGL